MRLTKRREKNEHRIAVLVIDNDEEFGFMMNDIIQSFGCKCDILHSATEVYEHFNDNYYDLAFADVCIPNFDLDTMLKYCGARFPQIKVVVMSALLDQKTLVKYLQYSNVINVFEKQSSDLKEVVSKCLANVMNKIKT